MWPERVRRAWIVVDQGSLNVRPAYQALSLPPVVVGLLPQQAASLLKPASPSHLLPHGIEAAISRTFDDHSSPCPRGNPIPPCQPGCLAEIMIDQTPALGHPDHKPGVADKRLADDGVQYMKSRTNTAVLGSSDCRIAVFSNLVKAKGGRPSRGRMMWDDVDGVPGHWSIVPASWR